MCIIDRFIPLPPCPAGRFGMVFYNNLLTSCLLTPAAFAVGDFQIFLNTPQLHTLTYTAINLFSGEGRKYVFLFPDGGGGEVY